MGDASGKKNHPKSQLNKSQKSRISSKTTGRGDGSTVREIIVAYISKDMST